MTASTINAAQQFATSFVTNNGTGINLSVLLVANNIFSRYDRGSNLGTMVAECDRVCKLGKGLFSASKITARILDGSSLNTWDTLRDTGNILSGTKSAIVDDSSHIGLHWGAKCSESLGALSGIIAIACQVKKDGIKSLQTWIVIYHKVNNICKAVFVWVGTDVAVVGAFKENVYNIVYHKNTQLFVGAAGIGNALLSHQDNKLWKASGLNQYFESKTATAA